MTIGEALKEEQDKLGLTEEKMVQGIMSKSAYSRVIHNERNISSKALVKILFKNGIDIITFFSKTEDTYLSESSKLEKKLSCAIGEAVNNHEVDKVKLYYRIIVNSDVSSYLKKRAKLAYYFLDNKMKYIDDDFKKSIIADLNDNDNWVLNVNVLRLFSSALIVLPHRNVEAEISFFF